MRTFVTEKYWQPTGIAGHRSCGFGTMGCLGINILFVVMRLCSNLHSVPLGCFSGRIGELHGILNPPFKQSRMMASSSASAYRILRRTEKRPEVALECSAANIQSQDYFPLAEFPLKSLFS